MKDSICLFCKTKFKYDKSKSTGKYCNNACQGQFIFHNITIPKIEKGECSQAVTLKKYISKLKGYKCEICNISEWNKIELSLHLDHIDGNSDNNFPQNLRLLCPNCHSQTETYCSRNRKNSKRSCYKKRYRLRNLF